MWTQSSVLILTRIIIAIVPTITRFTLNAWMWIYQLCSAGRCHLHDSRTHVENDRTISKIHPDLHKPVLYRCMISTLDHCFAEFVDEICNLYSLLKFNLNQISACLSYDFAYGQAGCLSATKYNVDQFIRAHDEVVCIGLGKYAVTNQELES